MSMKKRLREAREAWNNGKERSGGFEDLPDGYYVAVLKGAEVRESESGKLGFMITYEVIDGEHEGERIIDWNSLEHEVSCSILARKLGKMGIAAPDDPADLEDSALELEELAPRVRLKLKSRKSNDRVFQGKDVDRLLGHAEADDDDDEKPAKSKSTSASKGKSKKPEPAPEPDDEDDDDEEVEVDPDDVKPGARVAVFPEDEDGEEDEGVVTAVDGDTITVKIGDDEVEVSIADIAEVIEKAPEKKRGRRSKTDPSEKATSSRRGRASSKDSDDEDDDGDSDDSDDDDDDDDDDEEGGDEVELEVGMRCTVEGMGECDIAKLDEKAGLVTVKPIAGGRAKRVSPDKIAVIPAAAQDAEPPKRGKSRRSKK